MAEVPKDRLPRTSEPRRYELELAPDLVRFRFEGSETVTLDVVEPTATLVLNASDLDVHEARLQLPAGGWVEGRPVLDEQAKRLTVSFDEALDAGEGYKLQLRFTGSLNDQLHGFYRSIYRAPDGSEHVIATTQFEPSDARRAFPCWDEPEFKATYQISLLIDDRLTAISNAAVESEESIEGGRKRVKFKETMVMSTYVVAFVVGPYELTDPVDVDGVPLRIAAVPGKGHLTGFAVETGVHALRFLAGYFGIPYPGDKLDHVAIPDFAFGAMENLGCVTYRENALLIDPAAASQLELQRVAQVVAHETAHMWFGDLVTMRWWNGIWLNEAFATFMELVTNDDFRPEWEVWTSFGISKAAALATDALHNTRPVEYPVGPPEEAESMFDVLTYQKGAAVLRMLEQYLGPETFRKGISHYLTTHAFSNTETGDLWDALEDASGEPVGAIMDTWICQGGCPLISVDAGESDGSIVLRQRRFLFADDDGEDRRWHVPVNLRASVGGEIQHQRLLLDGDTASVDFDGPIDWVVVNDGGWGFYRVQYAPALMSRLKAAGIAEVCSPLERMGLVNDTWVRVVAGQAEPGEWVEVLECLGTEEDPDVWASVVAAFNLLDHIADDDDRAALQAFVRKVAQPAWNLLGWDPPEGESRRRGITRGRLLTALGLVGADPAVRKEAVSRFERFAAENAGLAPDLLTPAANVVAASGGEKGWDAILVRYRSGSTPQDKVRYLDALGSAADPKLLERTLELALSDDVRIQDGSFLVGRVMANRVGGRLAWGWLESRWTEVQSRFPPGLVARIFDSITGLVEPDLAASIRRFVAEHEIPQAGPRLEQLVERMDINVALASRLRGTLRAALGQG